ncbi:MAG: hypothetical protein HY927_08225 [Elusimicrobia bacterium]|nr:hypothetical protein [Elusimicrobiota bacterium]
MRRSTASLLILALALAAASARADEPNLDFDRGIDTRSVLQHLRDKRDDPAPALKASTLSRRTDRDCVTFSFDSQDPLASERVHLISHEYREVCHHGPNGQTNCHEELAWTYRASVRVQIADRGPMLPWERDVFWVCLDGNWLQGDVLDASHKYDLKFQGGSDKILLAKALQKTAALPDPNGITASAPRPDAANLALDLQDRWGEYYAGESTVLTVELKRSRDMWFDALVLQKEIALPAAKAYTVRFADYAAEFSEKLQPGSKYYVNWRFKRVGLISKDKWMKYRETDKAVFGQAWATDLAGPWGPSTSEKSVVSTALKVCWLKTIDKNDCVYKCSDKTEHRQPAASQDPAHPGQPVLACPQLVFPF